jgi:serine/threonine protein kinase/TolB-like protein/Flp pilus assembly protein TadD
MTPERWQQLKQIFQSALERNPAERSAFLRQACAGDPALRSEVESLISSHDQAGDSIEAMAVEAATEMLSDRADPIAGKHIGHYQVLSLIGRGGMGEVFLAQDASLGRKVALKLLRAEFTGDEERLRRFRQEARAASALNHPNIVTIYEIGEAEVGRVIVMEFIEGRTLREVAREPLSLEAVLKLCGQIAKALNVAHTAGIIHRDIKPENIMVRNDGYVKVLDFGVARLAAVRVAELSVNEERAYQLLAGAAADTNPGTIIGTPAYMSPEQAARKSITGAADIFSLGIILYELATGQHPFKRDSQLACLHAIIEEQPITPSRLNPEIPTALEALILRMLEKDPRLRPDAGEVDQTVTEIERARSGGAGKEDGRKFDPAERHTVRREQGRVELLAAGNERRRRASRRLFAISALVPLVAGLIYLLLLRTSPTTVSPNIRSVAVLPLENLSGDPSQDYFADGMTDEMIANLGKIRALRVTSRTSVMQYKGAKKSLSEIARALNVDGVIEGSVKLVGNRVRITAQLIEAKADRQLWSESYERDVRDILALQDEVARAIAEAVKIKLAPEERMRLSRVRSVDPEAQEAYFKGRYHAGKRNEEGLRTAITYYQEAIAKDKLYPLPHIGLADAYQALGTFLVGALPPAESFPKVEAEAREALNLDETLAEGHTFLAVMQLYRWEWREAEQGFKRALELNPSHALSHSWYAQYLASQGRLDEARAEAKRALELDPLSPYIVQNVAHIAYYARQYDEMIEYSRRAIELDPNYVWARWRRGTAYVMQSRFEEAIEEGERAAALSRRGPAALSYLGMAYCRAGRRGEAQQVLNELVELSKRTYVNPFSFFSIHLGLGQNDQALERLEEAVQSHLSGMIFIRVNPEFDPIRSEPRFKELVRRMGLSDQNAAITTAS